MGTIHYLVEKLDLTEHFESLSKMFARPKELAIEGDRRLHFELIRTLSSYQFNPPPPLKTLDGNILHLSKQGILGVETLFEFSKLVSYFLYLKKVGMTGKLGSWMDSIVIPVELAGLGLLFNREGDLKDEIDERLLTVSRELQGCKQAISKELYRLLHTEKLRPYLVDHQIHLYADEECLMVRPGYSHALRAKIVGRTQSGFFYVSPHAADALKHRLDDLIAAREQIRYEICKKYSQELARHLLFLKFINRQFDRFDHYQARVLFAESLDLVILEPSSTQTIILNEFVHPALNQTKAKPFSINFSKKALLITGVNAGGKTMLLKSILSATLMAKYLIPMKINEKSVIASFHDIEAVVEDPQNVKDDISTFAGRMVRFSKLLSSQHPTLIGVDEVELGTDSDEAASLFKVLIEKLIAKGNKIVLTTHHKRLAALLAANEEVELVAALYDERAGAPTYEFLQGSIGKSYAFETAIRYGIPGPLIFEAKKLWGEDKERLGELIERSTQLELQLRQKMIQAEKEAAALQNSRYRLEEEYGAKKAELLSFRTKLESEFRNATNIAKEAARQLDPRDIHRKLNEAQNSVKAAPSNLPSPVVQKSFSIGDSIRFGSLDGTIVRLDDKTATIESDGKTLRVELYQLQQRARHIPASPKKKQHKTSIKVEKPTAARLKLDLHGLRVEEALGILDKFISDALIEGFEELFIYHGIGTGRLAKSVREYLEEHPSVKDFEDAPPNLGGFGATIVQL